MSPAERLAGERGRRWRRHHLFWHVYGFGVGLIILAGAAAALATATLGRPPAWRDLPARTRAWIGERLQQAGPQALAAELRSVEEHFAVRVAVWGPEGEPVAGTTAPLPEDQRQQAEDDPSGHGRHLVTLREGDRLTGYAEIAPASGPGWRFAAGIAAALLAVAGVSLVVARRISRPLERLTAAVRTFGDGDLSTRTSLRAHGEVGELARAFDEMADRVQRLVRGEKELIANVSHELRTPLARIRIALETAEEGDAAEARASLGEIATDLVELEQLVDDVLTSSRLQLGGSLPLRTQRVPGAGVVDAAASRFRARFPRHALDVQAAELPDVEVDPALLRRAIDNLLDNARKYGGDSAIRLLAHADGGDLVVEVRDRGPGLPAEELERVFEPFYRAEKSRSRRGGGVGLGLPLARRIAEAHGGTLALEPGGEGGTVARLRIPGAA